SSEDLRIARDQGAAVYAQRLVQPRDQEQKSGPPGFEDVADRVEQLVALRIGENEPSLVQNLDEPGRAPARRNVTTPVGRARREQKERCSSDEVAAVAVEAIDDLVPRHLRRAAAIDRDQLL